MPDLNKMMIELGPGSLDRLADGTWVWQVGSVGNVYSGNSPQQAIQAAYKAEVQQA